MKECFLKGSIGLGGMWREIVTQLFSTVRQRSGIIWSSFMLHNGDRVLTDSNEIVDCTVKYFNPLFSSNPVILQDYKMMKETIPSLVDDSMNHIFTRLPSLE